LISPSRLSVRLSQIVTVALPMDATGVSPRQFR
jgi:hypothetical protein